MSNQRIRNKKAKRKYMKYQFGIDMAKCADRCYELTHSLKGTLKAARELQVKPPLGEVLA